MDPPHHGTAGNLPCHDVSQDCFYLGRFNGWWMNLKIEYGLIIFTNILLFRRRYSTEWAENESRKRIMDLRRLSVDKQQQFLIPPTDKWMWGKQELYNKESLAELIAGKLETRRDKTNMDLFLRNSSINKVQLPREPKHRQLFNPIDVPLLDILAVDSDCVDSWNMPDRKCIREMQENRGLSLVMRDLVEVREIVVGVTSPAELKEKIDWMWKRYEANQAELPTAVLSLDVEEVPAHLYDEYRLVGLIKHKNEFVELSVDRETEELYPGVPDKNIQIPVRIMIGERSSCHLMTTKVRRSSSRTVRRVPTPENIAKKLFESGNMNNKVRGVEGVWG